MNEITIPLPRRALPAVLQTPHRRSGVVAFVHGSGVDRHDERDRNVVARLAEAGLVTLQPELLDGAEASEPHNVFDTELQCARLLETLEWVEREAWAQGLPLGLFAGGIGAGVALLAAAKRPQRVAAVVCRGGRPDCALFWLPQVKAPTLLIVEADGWPYRQAYERLAGTKELVVVPSASGLFREPAAVEAVAKHARHWFSRHLT